MARAIRILVYDGDEKWIQSTLYSSNRYVKDKIVVSKNTDGTERCTIEEYVIHDETHARETALGKLIIENLLDGSRK